MTVAEKVWDTIRDIGNGAQRAERKPKRVYDVKGPNGKQEVARRLDRIAAKSDCAPQSLSEYHL